VEHAAPPGSVGTLVGSTECRIVGVESARDLCGADECGEILVRGPQVMKGYLGRPDATRATLDADGWLHTGDVGRVDVNGALHVVDRLKELIKYKGFQIAPAELEAVLVAHPDVADAAVIPIADERAGEVPKAFVVRRREGGAVDEAELRAFVAARVAPHKRIASLEFVAEIPRSASGKILRRTLVEQERAKGPRADSRSQP
jgi:acyl-CoA synthetase (AMP-forming)/AMP-acid ligase II